MVEVPLTALNFSGTGLRPLTSIWDIWDSLSLMTPDPHECELGVPSVPPQLLLEDSQFLEETAQLLLHSIVDLVDAFPVKAKMLQPVSTQQA